MKLPGRRSSSTSKKRDILSLSKSIFNSAKRAMRRKKSALEKNKPSDDSSIDESLGTSSISDDNCSFTESSEARTESLSTIGDGDIPENIFSGESLEDIQHKSFVALEQICGALELYGKKEEEVRTAPKYHLDRAKARMEYKNTTGALISMRRYKKLEGEYNRLDNAIQYLSMNKVALVRFQQKIKDAIQDPSSGSTVVASFSSQCDRVCDALIETQQIVQQDEQGQKDSFKDEEIMEELERLMSPESDSSAEFSKPRLTREALQELDETAFDSDDDDDDDDSSTDESEDGELQAADEQLLSELSGMIDLGI